MGSKRSFKRNVLAFHFQAFSRKGCGISRLLVEPALWEHYSGRAWKPFFRGASLLALQRITTVDELVKLVSAKTGLSPEMSKTAVETVVGYLKKQLPAPLAAQVDAALAGGADSGGLLGNVTKGIGDMLGGGK